MNPRVGIGTGENRIECLRKAFDSLGGIGQWVKPGMTVMLKPNIMSPQGSPSVTHIDMLKGLYILCKEAGAVKVLAGDNSVCGFPPRKMMEMTGIAAAMESIGIEVCYFDEEQWVYRRRDDNFCLKDMHLPKRLVEADLWITVPVAKTHEACVTTLGIKNSHGILPDEDKARHHRGRTYADTSLWEKFVDILATCKPDLCVCDMYHAMEGEGPAFGELVEMKLVVVSDDTVACDSVVQELMGINSLKDAPLTAIAHKRGLGCADISQIEILGEKIADHRRIFKRAEWRPDIGVPDGLRIMSGDVCHGGCQMVLRYLIEAGKILFGKDAKEFGDIYILTGDTPPPPPEDRFVLVFGDCAIYSTWHYDYRQRGKRIGPWWNTRPGFIDVPGCCPVQLGWLKSFAELATGYAPGATMADAVRLIEADEYTFAE